MNDVSSRHPADTQWSACIPYPSHTSSRAPAAKRASALGSRDAERTA